MKILLIILTVNVWCVFGDDYPSIEPGDTNNENFLDLASSFANNSRAASGTTARRGENLDFCYLSVRFQHKWLICGCVLMDSQWVATSARCVIE